MLIKQSIIEMRAEEARHAEIHNRKYRKLVSRTCEVQDKLKALVPEDKHELFYNLLTELEDAISQSGGIEQDEAYKQGFYDGLEIAAIMVKRGINL